MPEIIPLPEFGIKELRFGSSGIREIRVSLELRVSEEE